jgi:hypothetical protein
VEGLLAGRFKVHIVLDWEEWYILDQSGIHAFSKYVLCNFSYIIDSDAKILAGWQKIYFFLM